LITTVTPSVDGSIFSSNPKTSSHEYAQTEQNEIGTQELEAANVLSTEQILLIGGAIVLTILHLIRWKSSTTTKEPNITTRVSGSVSTANSPTATDFDWKQYNYENPEEDVPPGWVSSDEDINGGYSGVEEPMPPATCSRCTSALISQADLYCHNGNVVCKQSDLITASVVQNEEEPGTNVAHPLVVSEINIPRLAPLQSH
jgi:hypothetical protein